MKIHIPNSLYEEAKNKQRLYRGKGINKLMVDCVAEIYMEKDGLVPDLKEMQREISRLSSHFEGDKGFFPKKRGGWMQ